MNQRELNREVAFKTGETISEIARRGFGLDRLPPIDPRTPLDWDWLDLRRNTAFLPDRQQHAA